MSVGAVLLQPERVQRAAGVDASVVADTLGLLRALVDEGRSGGPLAADVEAALDAFAGRLIATIGPRGATAAARLGSLVGPALEAVDAHVGAIGSAEGPEDVAAVLVAILEDLARAATAADLERLRHLIRTLVQVVEVDLGLSTVALRAELLALADDLATRLEAPRPAADAATRRRAGELARLLRRWRSRAATLPAPTIDADAVARELFERLRAAGVEEVLARVRCVGEALRAAIDAGTALTAAVAFTGFGRGSVGAAAAPAATGDQHCWYLTWLLGAKEPWYLELVRTVLPWIPYDEVWVDTAAGKVMRRDVFGEHVEVAPTTDWTQAWPLRRDAPAEKLTPLGLDAPYTFGRNDEVQTLERVAFVSAVVVNALESLLHLISLEEGDYASNAVNAASTAGFAIASGVRGAPAPWWLDTLLLRTGGTLLASLEGIHTRANAKNCMAMWLTLVGPDLGEVVAYRVALTSLRDALLSFLTLRNHEQPTTPGLRRPTNRLETAGFVAPFVSLTAWVNRCFVPRKVYGIENLGKPEVLLVWLLGAPIMGIFGSLLGHVLTEHAIARAGDYGAFGGHVLKTVFKEWVMFIPSWYLDADGGTSDGRFNPDGDDFPGYPDADSSPYRLPWAAGRSVYVGQGNQGFFSHFAENGEVYAYDFSMDQDEEVLAARAGTVVSFRDGMEDDSENLDADGNARANRIRIRHDLDGPLDGHDRDENGTVMTYAGYLHGRKGSIAEAFASRGITETSIVGSPVQRGDVIMRAGDTGKSFHNHLHMEVYPDNGSGNPNTNVTLPFVFREVGKRHEIGELFGLLGNPAGVPTRFNSYTSENG
jgi:hypothetical protein